MNYLFNKIKILANAITLVVLLFAAVSALPGSANAATNKLNLTVWRVNGDPCGANSCQTFRFRVYNWETFAINSNQVFWEIYVGDAGDPISINTCGASTAYNNVGGWQGNVGNACATVSMTDCSLDASHQANTILRITPGAINIPPNGGYIETDQMTWCNTLWNNWFDTGCNDYSKAGSTSEHNDQYFALFQNAPGPTLVCEYTNASTVDTLSGTIACTGTNACAAGPTNTPTLTWTPTFTPTPVPIGSCASPVQAEDFVNASDSDAPNNGGAYRNAPAAGNFVDIEATTDVGGGFDVGWTANAEWLEYTISVPTTGTYDFTIRNASGAGGSTVQLAIDGVASGGGIALPATGGWQTWTSTVSTGHAMTAGTRTLRVTWTAGGSNLNWICAVLAGPTPTPTLTPLATVVPNCDGTTNHFPDGGFELGTTAPGPPEQDEFGFNGWNQIAKDIPQFHLEASGACRGGSGDCWYIDADHFVSQGDPPYACGLPGCPAGAELDWQYTFTGLNAGCEYTLSIWNQTDHDWLLDNIVLQASGYGAGPISTPLAPAPKWTWVQSTPLVFTNTTGNLTVKLGGIPSTGLPGDLYFDDISLTCNCPTDTPTPELTFTPTNTATATPVPITKSVNLASANIGDTLTYTINYQNPNSATPPPACTDTFETGATFWDFDWTDGPVAPTGGWNLVADNGPTNAGSRALEGVNVGATYPYTILDCPGLVTDGSIQADIKIMNATGEATLLWRQNGSSTYQVHLNANLNTVELRVINSGAPTTLASIGYTLNAGTWYTFRFEVIGFTLNAYINGSGVPNITAVDPNVTFNSGGAGIETDGSTTTRFDNVIVTEYPQHWYNVSIVDALPAGLTYVSNSCGGSESGGTVTIDLGTVNAGASGSCQIVVTVAACGDKNNTADLNVGLPAQSYTSNSADTTNACPTNTPTPGPSATPLPVNLVKSVNVASATIGDTVTFCIDWENTTGGPVDVRFWDTVPYVMAYVGSDNGGTYDPLLVSWELGSQASGASGTVCFWAVLSAYPWWPMFNEKLKVAAREVDVYPEIFLALGGRGL